MISAGAATHAAAAHIIQVAGFKGIQVTGVSVAQNGRIFANFPRWRPNVPLSVAEVMANGSYCLHPSELQNSWQLGAKPDKHFIAVQSVVAHGDYL